MCPVSYQKKAVSKLLDNFQQIDRGTNIKDMRCSKRGSISGKSKKKEYILQKQ